MINPHRLAALAILIGLAPIAASADQDPKADLKRFEGVWKVTRAEKDGKALPDEMLKDIKVTIAADRFTIKDGKDEDVAIIKVDASKKPGLIDFVPADDVKQLAPGIFTFEGETLKICWAKVGGERPKEFSSRAENENRLFILVKDGP